MDPRPTPRAPELDHESPQEELDREQRPGNDDPEAELRGRVCGALAEAGSLRNDELVKALGYEGDPEEWKRRLWRLHNEGFVKVRWVGHANPDPVEVRLTPRGRSALEGSAAGARAFESLESATTGGSRSA